MVTWTWRTPAGDGRRLILHYSGSRVKGRWEEVALPLVIPHQSCDDNGCNEPHRRWPSRQEKTELAKNRPTLKKKTLPYQISSLWRWRRRRSYYAHTYIKSEWHVFRKKWFYMHTKYKAPYFFSEREWASDFSVRSPPEDGPLINRFSSCSIRYIPKGPSLSLSLSYVRAKKTEH